MEREKTLRIILKSIFPIVFNTAFFVLVVFNTSFFVLGGTEHKASVWISYGFIHFAYVMVLLMPKLVPSSKSKALFEASSYSISLAYFFVELVVGSLFIVIAPEGYTTAFLVQFCLAGVYGAVLTIYMLANEWTAKAEKANAFIKDASVKLKGLLAGINDPEARKKVERAYDTLYSSPVKSHPDLRDAESGILQSIRDLETAVTAGHTDDIIALAGSLESAIADRNRRLGAYN